MPAISVIIPAYNAQETILETIQSVQNQTFSDFEIVVINDGSTDGTLEKLATVNDPRLKIFSYENGGLPTARNRGIAQSTAEYLSFIDADDLWSPEKLEDQLNALKNHPDAGVAYSWTAFINEKSEFIYAYEPTYYEGDVYAQILVRQFIANGSNIMMRRRCIEDVGVFDPELKSAEDWEYCIRLAARFPFAVVPKYQILYRRSSNSMTSKVDVMEQSYRIVHERAFAAAPEPLKALKNQSLADAYRFYSMLYVKHEPNRSGVRKAWERLGRAIQLHPKILLERRTQRLLLKYLLLTLVPYEVATRFSSQLARLFPDAATKSVSIAS